VPAVGTPRAPRLFGPPRRLPTSWPACACRRSTSRTAPWGDPEPHTARLAARLGLGTQPRGTESCPLQAAGPGLIDTDPVDKVLRALVVELGLNRADELPEQHELDSPSDLPAG
ncbi:CITE1 protein, partial [Acrocephalus arundinaceus]|nr:CITE1 protein [Acrocephalus arundinaceus]